MVRRSMTTLGASPDNRHQNPHPLEKNARRVGQPTDDGGCLHMNLILGYRAFCLRMLEEIFGWELGVEEQVEKADHHFV